MNRKLLNWAAITAGGLSLVGCARQGTVGVTYTEPTLMYVQPGPAVGFYEGPVYYDSFDLYWRSHRDWDRDNAWRQWQRHPREHRRDERREQR